MNRGEMCRSREASDGEKVSAVAVMGEDTRRQADWSPVFGRGRERRGSEPAERGAVGE